MFSGLQNPFSIKLRLFGLGFKIKKVDNLLFFKLGHTHEIKVFLPESILFYQAKTKTNIYTFRSIDLKILSQFVSKIRELKKVEPYKGKGFRYFDEIIKKKEGKKNNV
jgi:large subunit ribosomal protein L6